MEENSGLDNIYLPDVQPSEPEEERREVYQEMTNEYETTVQMENEGLSQQEVDAMNAEQPEVEPDDMADAHVTPNERNREGEQGYRWPRRERRPPKTFTYDYLGTPACDRVEHLNPGTFQPIQYGMQNLTQWTPPVPPYQPVYLYTYKDLYAY